MTNELSHFVPPIPGWEVIRTDYIEPGLPGRIVVRSEPRIEIFVDVGARRFGAAFTLAQGVVVPTSTFRDITINEVRFEGRRCVEIAAENFTLFGTFYLLLSDIVRAVLDEGIPPIAAIETSLLRWKTLLQMSALLSEERQLGLTGELWMLERLLLDPHADDALNSWVGPDRQAHDFRLRDNEFEVKTTSGPRRVHTINGIHQLEPSADTQLYVVSLRVIDAGSGGETLGERVDRLASLLRPHDLPIYFGKLSAVGYRPADMIHYSRRRRLADAPRLIRVEDGVPRLTPEALVNFPGRFVSERITDIVYRIDVEGMGFGDGTPEFEAILPTKDEGR